MKILDVERFTEGDLIDRLRKVSMLKDPEIFPYKNARIRSKSICPTLASPAQRYVLTEGIERARKLRWALADYGVNTLTLDGFVRMYLEGQAEPVDLLPPIVERWVEGDGEVHRIVNDGMHRMYEALLSCNLIYVIHIDHIPEHLPYYAHPIPGANPWDKVEMVDSLYPGLVKKWHRTPDNKKLYRNFNSAFMNVGGPRGDGTT